VVAAGHSFHSKCFTCEECNRRLDSTILADKDEHIFCKVCYGKKYGPKGYGYGGGAGVLSTHAYAGHDDEASPEPKLLKEKPKFCAGCGEPKRAGKFCGSCGAPQVDHEKITTPAPKVKASTGHKGSDLSTFSGTAAAAPTKSKFGGGEKCVRCGKTAYEAERVPGPGGFYHTRCFNCVTCKKGLAAADLCDKDGEAYCKACYAKNFGPKGYGYGVGAGTMAYTQ